MLILIHLRNTFAKLKSIFINLVYHDVLLSFFMSYSFSENDGATESEAISDISCEEGKQMANLAPSPGARMETATLLDLYSGCGAMSTGLCLGAAFSDVKLNTVCSVLWMS